VKIQPAGEVEELWIMPCNQRIKLADQRIVNFQVTVRPVEKNQLFVAENLSCFARFLLAPLA